MFTVNHSEAVEKSFKPLAEGEYEAIVTGVEIKQTQKGADMLKLEYTIRDDVDQEGKKSKVWDNVTFMDTTKWRYQLFFKALGLANGLALATMEDVAKAVLHKPIRIRTKNEEYNGKTYAKVASFLVATKEYGAPQDISSPFDVPTTTSKPTGDLPF